MPLARRQAHIEERATAALGRTIDKGRLFLCDQVVKAPRGILGHLTQRPIEVHVFAPTDLTVEQGSGADGDLQHFLETQSLSAKLRAVAVDPLRLSAFVFHRKWAPVTAETREANPVLCARHTMEFDHVCSAGQAKA